MSAATGAGPGFGKHLAQICGLSGSDTKCEGVDLAAGSGHRRCVAARRQKQDEVSGRIAHVVQPVPAG
jgi:hypothetical protein